MAHHASAEHILKEVGLGFSSSVYNSNCFKKNELAKQNLAIFCSILTGMGLEFKMLATDNRKIVES